MNFDGFQDVSFITGPGIYLLMLKGEVRYVGQSRKLCARITQHKNNWVKYKLGKPMSEKAIKFDEVKVFPCKIPELNRLEREFIHKYTPVKNTWTYGKINKDLAPIINVVMAKCQGEDLRRQEGSRQFANSLRRM